MQRIRRIVFYIAIFVILALLVFFFYKNRQKIVQILVPFILSLVIAYLIYPIVIKLEKRKISRKFGILLIYLIFSLLVFLVVTFIIPEIIDNTRDLANTLPELTLQYQNIFDKIISIIKTSRWSDDFKNTLFQEMQNTIIVVQNIVMDFLKKSVMTMVGAVTLLFDLVLAMVLAYYFIKDAETFRKSAMALIPVKWRNSIAKTCREINSILSNFIQGQMLDALIIGIIESAGLFIIKLKYPLVLGLIGGLANIIPYFGPIIGAVPAIAVALLQSPVKALWTALVFIIVQQIDNTFISPKIIEGKLGLHPVTTILAVLVGGEFFGILGMLVAVPIMAILKVIFKKIVEAIV